MSAVQHSLSCKLPAAETSPRKSQGPQLLITGGLHTGRILSGRHFCEGKKASHLLHSQTTDNRCQGQVFILMLVPKPFQQLVTINAFVRSVDHTKQVPLLFVLVSVKSTKDYKNVTIYLLFMYPKA